MKFKIKINDIEEFEAENMDEANNIAIDIVNDIGHDGAYEIEEVAEK